MIVYHGTTSKFDHFDLTHLGEGEGKSKFGVGHYVSSVKIEYNIDDETLNHFKVENRELLKNRILLKSMLSVIRK